jgi:hypothetical protein
MRLTIGDEVFGVRQLGPDFIMLRNPAHREPTEGEMFLSVDGSERRWRVSLQEGISPDIERTPIKAIR